ncbi:MAG: pentapeptide repeat-containing protein [Acidobacteriia bacterium]|nr:pentapeptide repeat-containing protein [Terriglobia bacterium]
MTAQKAKRPAQLSGEDLHDMDLRGYLFARANLTEANLSGANLADVELSEASLRFADLTNSTGLTARQLRGADLSLARLPAEVVDSLNSQPGVDEASKTSRKILLTMLAACLYCWLTILSTTDAGLLVGSSMLSLPIVQTPIPVVAFFGAAPVLLLIIYLYLHFSLQNLWDALATLPAYFPDGRPLHQRALPWILSPIVRLHFKLLAPSCPPLTRIQVKVTAILVWWGVPLTMLAFFLRSLVRQDPSITQFRIPVISSLHVVMVGVSVWLSLVFSRSTKETLRGIERDPAPWYRAPLSREVLAGLLVSVCLAVFAGGCLYGKPATNTRLNTLGDDEYFWDWRTAAPHILSLLGWNAFGDLSRVDLSQRPPGWSGKDLTAVKGAQLQGRSLRNIRAQSAFGAKANFRSANLQNADFGNADLRGADFSEASLEGADFFGADLRGADFREAHTRGAIFTRANIESAHLDDVNLEEEHVERAWNWPLAHLDRSVGAFGPCNPNERPSPTCDETRRDFSGLDLARFGDVFRNPNFSGANLQRATLPADLTGADFSRADLRNAVIGGVGPPDDVDDVPKARGVTDLTAANLEGADLRGVDLTRALGMTRVQIESALIDDKTVLPRYLKAQKPFTPKK